MKHILLSLLFCLYALTVFADNFLENNTDIVGIPEVSYEKLSGQYLQFNCLRDRGAEFVDFDLFDGSELNDSNYCNRYTFADIARSIRSMLASSPSWNAEEMLAVQDELGDENNAIIGIMHYRYLYIKENALRDSLIRYENGYVYDNFINGVHQNPYDINPVLAFAAQDTIFNNSVTFSFPSSTYQSNYGGTFYFDAGDGAGYRKFNLNDKISVNYTSGCHELKLKIDVGGKTLVAHSKITTFDLSNNPNSRNGQPIYDNLFTSETIIATYNGSPVIAKLSRYRHSHGKQPFIYVEGFDIPIYGNMSKIMNEGGYGTQGPMSIYLSQGIDENIFSSYDFYYLDFVDGTISNRAKAELLKYAIQQVNSSKTSSYQNIVFGSSMGGITARYCLCKMEEDGIKHQTALLVCQDTPNLGANIPLGALYASQELLRLYNRYGATLKMKNIKDNVGFIKQIIDSDAAKEVLYNYVNPNGDIDNTVHQTFYNELQSLGYPAGDNGLLRCIAICNGNEQITPPNETLLHLDFNVTPKKFTDLLLNIYSPFLGPTVYLLSNDVLTSLLAMVPGSSRLIFNCDIRPTGSNKNICDMKLTYKKKVLWLANVKTTLYKYSKSAPSSSINYDISKGSYYDLDFDINLDNMFTLDPVFAFFIKIGDHLKMANRFLFIPTASALDIGGGMTALTQNDYMASYSMENRPLKPKNSPFHAYYISSAAERHIQFSSEMNQWLRAQLSTFVAGNKIGTTGSKYILNNNANNKPVTWSTSDESIATIDNNGILTEKKHGFVTILATLSTGESYPKRIMVGLPKYLISTFHTSTTYELSPSPLADYHVYQDYCDLVKFQISINSPIQWMEMKDNKYIVNLTSSGEQKTFYIRPYYVYDDDIIYGPSSYITINTALPYAIEPNYITYRGGKLSSITVKQNPYYIGSIPADFKICNVDCKGSVSSNLLNLNSVTSVTLQADNIFPSGMIEWFINSSNYSISEKFTIRGKKGNIIQTFNVPLIKQ